MEDTSSINGYQVVIVVDYNDNSRMFPILQDEFPLCLLPIANRTLLSYQLDRLVANGIKEALLVAPLEYCNALTNFLNIYGRDSITIDLIPVHEITGSVDALKAICDRIHSDVIVLSSDSISQYPLHDMIHLHQLHSADIISTFATLPMEEFEKNSKLTLKSAKIDIEDQEFIGLTDSSRIVLKIPSYEVEESFQLNKYLLHICEKIRVRNDLIDIGCYILSKWIFSYLKTCTQLTTIRTDLLPYFVHRQFQKATYLFTNIPALKNRQMPLQDLDDWLAAGTVATSEAAGIESSTRKSFLSRLSSFSSVDASMVDGIPSTSTGLGNNKDLLKCFAVVREQPPVAANGSEQELSICRRVTSIQSYMNLNRDLLGGIPSTSPWPRLQGYLKKELSVVGENSVLGEKVTIKQCSIGRDCKIGAKSKLNNCILMDGVIVGESCTIQNSILCGEVVIESNCNVNECQIGAKYVVVAGSKLKSEPLN